MVSYDDDAFFSFVYFYIEIRHFPLSILFVHEIWEVEDKGRFVDVNIFV